MWWLEMGAGPGMARGTGRGMIWERGQEEHGRLVGILSQPRSVARRGGGRGTRQVRRAH